MKKRFVLGLLTVVACAPGAGGTARGPQRDACTVIRDVRVFDGEVVREHAAVQIEAGRIETGKSNRCANVIDGTGKTLLPGLIDAHSHVHDEDALRTALRFGVTTVLDMMTTMPAVTVRLKKEAAVREDLADLRSAGLPVTSRGGHGTEYGMPIPTLDRAADAAGFVDARIGEGSDYIKIIYTPDSTIFRSIDRTTLEAATAAAHARTRKVVVHVDTLRGARDALEVGADGLAHLFYDTAATSELVALARRRGAFVVPTLGVLRTVAGHPHGPELLRDPSVARLLGDEERRSLTETFPVHVRVDEDGVVRSIVALRAAGVPLLAGTDAPNPGTAQGASLHGELELLVAAGLTPIEALASATSRPAHAFGLADRGRIAPGLRADLLLVEGDPTHDVRATRHLVAVWRGGTRLVDAPPRPRATRPAVSDEASGRPQEAGRISDFEENATSSRFGLGWKTSTDDIAGGSSTGTIARVDAGASGSRGSLQVTGEVKRGVPFAWSGVMFNPGEQPFAPVDLSRSRELVFSSRGDGGTYAVLVFTRRRGRNPSRQTFVAGAAWARHRLPWASFDGSDGSDVLGIAFVAGPTPGAYTFHLDDVVLR